MKIVVLLLCLLVAAFGKENLNAVDTNSSETSDVHEPVVIKDMSGLSDDEVRQKAQKSDQKSNTAKKVPISNVVKSVDKRGKVDISKLQQPWEELSPTPDQYDWVETKKGEWFKGDIKGMFDNELEFESEEIGLYSFDFDDIAQIKSYHIIDVNIEGVATIPGILRYKDGKVRIIQGKDTYTFDKNQIVSFAISGNKERQHWSGKIAINFDARAGNRNQFDYTVQADLKRRTATNKLLLDYIGRISRSNGVETANDHRVNEKFDVYLTRYFFWTPIFAEYYTDSFKNIRSQYTLGVGLGYTAVKTKDMEWDFSGGPAVLLTNYITVPKGTDASVTSPSLELSTRLEYELSKITDITYQYKLTLTNPESGTYKHHMVLTLENELFEWLDFDITAIWDHTKIPEVDSNGITPLQNDYQLLVGIGIEF